MNLTIQELKSRLPQIREFLLRNIDLFEKPVKMRDNDWPKILKTLESEGYQTDPFYGKCCQVSHFLLFLTGGKEFNLLQLQLSQPRAFVPGKNLKTTHWWVKVVETNEIIDLTASQFIYGVPVDTFYPGAVKADVGWPYFKRGTGNSKYFNENVPTKQVLLLAKKFKEEFGTCYGMEVWLERLEEFEREK